MRTLNNGGNTVKTIAFLFPGQGSQVVGMGQDLFHEYDFVKEIFDAADDISGLPITQTCFNGPMTTLTQTVNLQPAITAVNLACLAAVQRAGVRCAFSAGHSLGEFSALNAAGVVSLTDTLRLVFKRGELMHRESLKHRGAMSAIIGLSSEVVAELVKNSRSAGEVSVANHNSERQIVITGAPQAVASVAEAARQQGARAIALKVSGAWHSELIHGAQDEFTVFLDSVPFGRPLSPVIHNVTADRCDDPEAIKRLLALQLCSPVRWYETIRKLVSEKVDVFVELGPGTVLAGLLKKIIAAEDHPAAYSISDLKTLESVVSKLV